MIVTGMTITSHRDDVVDFTFPFWTEYSAVIMRHKGNDPFRFLFLMNSCLVLYCVIFCGVPLNSQINKGQLVQIECKCTE